MDRKSCRIRERGKKSCSQTTIWVTWFEKRSKCAVTKCCCLGGFCPALEIGFPLSHTASQSVSGISARRITSHTRTHEIMLLLSSGNEWNAELYLTFLLNIIWKTAFYSEKKRIEFVVIIYFNWKDFPWWDDDIVSLFTTDVTAIYQISKN